MLPCKRTPREDVTGTGLPHSPRPGPLARAAAVNLLAAALLLVGCRTTPPLPPPPATPWADCYRVIDDPAAHAFVAAAQRALERDHAPAIPVRDVQLRLSRRAPAARRLRIAEGFTRTVCDDPAAGRFTIYLRVAPGHPEFYPLLGHECGHLLDARVKDWWMEGYCSLLSERLTREAGHSWNAWERRFRRRPGDPYTLAWRAARDLEAAVPGAFRDLLALAAAAPPAGTGDGGWRRLPLAQWLAALPPARRAVAEAVVSRPEYAPLAQRPPP